MKKTSIKRRHEHKTEKKKLRLPTSRTQPKASASLWKFEIDALKAQRFSSIHDAIDSVIERVLDRLAFAAAQRTSTKEYLRLVFETDESLQDELRRALHIDAEAH